ncbi:MAG TPA: hypothetical protein DC024_12965 [Clostridiales bacterium]|jgi:hypothetical protein|nr:hypothetical protein [Clostridiales bacterium]
MKNLFIKIFIALFAIVCLFSCSSDEYNPLGNPPEEGGGNTNPDTEYDVNLAFEAQTTASSYTDGESGNPYNLVDGKLSELNHSFGFLQSTTKEDQWIKIKLNKKQEVNEVKIYPKLGGEGIEGYPLGFIIQVSLDGDSWTDVYEAKDLKMPNTTRGEVYHFNNVEAEYVRLYVNDLLHIENMWTPVGGIYDAQLAEIEVYLRKESSGGGDDDPVSNYNLALDGTATTNNVIEEGKGPERAIDGIVDQRANFFGTLSQPDPYTADLTVELAKAQEINEVIMYPKVGGSEEEPTTEGFPIDFKIEVSMDKTTWTTVVDKIDFPAPIPIQGQGISFKFDKVEAKYVRLNASRLEHIVNMWVPDGVYILQFAEFEIYLDKQ